MPFGRRNPFEEINQLIRRMENEFESREWPAGTDVAVDIADLDDRYVVTADLPGFPRDDIDVRLAGRTLHLAAEHETESTDEDVDYLRRERRRRSVSRRVSLPDAVDEEGITATYNHGVLTVELPKREAGDGTRIDIE